MVKFLATIPDVVGCRLLMVRSASESPCPLFSSLSDFGGSSLHRYSLHSVLCWDSSRPPLYRRRNIGSVRLFPAMCTAFPGTLAAMRNSKRNGGITQDTC